MTNSPFLNIPFLSEEGTSVIQPLNLWFEVLDRMARRWKEKIDIYMGDDVGAARARS